MRFLILSVAFLLLACDESITEFHSGKTYVSGFIAKCDRSDGPYSVNYGGMVNDSVFSLSIVAGHRVITILSQIPAYS